MMEKHIPEEMMKQASDKAMEGKTPLFFSYDDTYLGMICVADTMKEDSPQAIKEMQNIKKVDLYNIDDLYLNMVIKMDKGEIYDDDLYVFEKGQEVKVCEQNMYNKLIDGLNADIDNMKSITDRLSVILNKIDL